MIEAKPGEAAAAGSSNTASETEASPQEQARREGMLTVASLILAGITVVGLTLMWGVMLWGRRLRRFARKTSPSPTVIDELWYLKAKKTIPSERSKPQGGESSNSDESTPS